MDANVDMQRRLTWKEIMENGSLESYSPYFTQDMLWAKTYVGHLWVNINDGNLPYHSRNFIEIHFSTVAIQGSKI